VAHASVARRIGSQEFQMVLLVGTKRAEKLPSYYARPLVTPACTSVNFSAMIVGKCGWVCIQSLRLQAPSPDIPGVLATNIQHVDWRYHSSVLITYHHAKEVHRSTNAGRSEWVVHGMMVVSHSFQCP